MLPDEHTELYDLASYDGPRIAKGGYHLPEPTTARHQETWALITHPQPAPPFPYLWLCLTHTDSESLGAGECGMWDTGHTLESTMADAAHHVALHERASLLEHCRTAELPPSPLLNPTEKQVEAALAHAQADGPCTAQAIGRTVLRRYQAARRAPGSESSPKTGVDQRHLETRLHQLLASGKATVHQAQEWRARTGISWPASSSGIVLWATRDQAEAWKGRPPHRSTTAAPPTGRSVRR
ncbi:hypothetical protein [Streptomyces sp. NBC_01601]|uniref:hypothetical protein n=1 Tax=Streptomyces sp. NBC_01601 TaxID=2975892 RepID=UPI002E27E26D|nr:hypothetical protein [Streptomyces sp. NBC_01601]